MRATTLIPHSGEEDLWLVTFTPVNKPSDRLFDLEWKDVQVTVKPEAIAALSREGVYTLGEIEALGAKT